MRAYNSSITIDDLEGAMVPQPPSPTFSKGETQLTKFEKQRRDSVTKVQGPPLISSDSPPRKVYTR